MKASRFKYPAEDIFIISLSVFVRGATQGWLLSHGGRGLQWLTVYTNHQARNADLAHNFGPIRVRFVWHQKVSQHTHWRKNKLHANAAFHHKSVLRAIDTFKYMYHTLDRASFQHVDQQYKHTRYGAQSLYKLVMQIAWIYAFKAVSQNEVSRRVTDITISGSFDINSPGVGLIDMTVDLNP